MSCIIPFTALKIYLFNDYNLEDTVQGTEDSDENQKDKILPSWSRSIWFLQEVDAESQLGMKEVNVCVWGGGVWCNASERYRGRKQNWARKLSNCNTDMIPVKGKS